ncbi:MAG: tetratricopeptide repeat protein [Alphaproteobacteria bacterium]
MSLGITISACSPADQYLACSREFHSIDEEKLVEKCSPLAAQGNLNAKYYLATYYYKRWRTSQNHANLAHQLSLEAASGGHHAAANFVGLTYYHGIGTDLDHAAAVHWFRISAKGGDHNGHYMLGKAYNEGTGVERDLVPAYVHTYVSAFRANVPLGQIGAARVALLNEIESRMSVAELAAAQVQLRELEQETARDQM